MEKFKDYSVLMSVYYKEKPEYLKLSMESIFNQTVKTDDFVLICDGPLNDELDKVINDFEKGHSELNVIRLEKNSGLGNALKLGVEKCKNELVLRQDSDDISKINRAEEQIKIFNNNEEISISSTYLEEFCDDVNDTIAIKKVPLTNDEIIDYSKKRNPFNHPSVMFKKEAVLQVGSYDETYHLFEDYYLWIRLLKVGYKGLNIDECLVYMRVPKDFYNRRGGKKYAKEMLKFHKWLKSIDWSNSIDYVTGAVPHAIISVMPGWLRKKVYIELRK